VLPQGEAAMAAFRAQVEARLRREYLIRFRKREMNLARAQLGENATSLEALLREKSREELETAWRMLHREYRAALRRLGLERSSSSSSSSSAGDEAPQASSEAETWKETGNRAFERGRYAEALLAYERALRFEPRSAVLLSNRAAVLTLLARHEDALADCRRALALQPGYAKAWGRLGTAYFHLGLPHEAVRAFEHALRLDPTNATLADSLNKARARTATVPAPDPNSLPPHLRFDFPEPPPT
jgi:tetratricopeptide (TPR) repeat protein